MNKDKRIQTASGIATLITAILTMGPFFLPDELIYESPWHKNHYKEWFNIYSPFFVFVISACYLNTIHRLYCMFFYWLTNDTE